MAITDFCAGVQGLCKVAKLDKTATSCSPQGIDLIGVGNTHVPVRAFDPTLKGLNSAGSPAGNHLDDL